MHPPRTFLLLPLLLLLIGFAVAACNSGGSDGKQASTNLTDVPTATLPDPLPEAIILGEAQPVADGSSYTVRAGDTLASIAARVGTTVDALIAANAGVDPTGLAVGQVLILPGGNTTRRDEDVLPATVVPTPQPDRSGETTYTVKSGDNSSNIADSFGVTLDELAAANNTTVDDLRGLVVGEVLTIPARSNGQ
ncbi:MAG: LysM peptidoglycan-binding domain-containing protein [Dehalococcoidia bacterium]